MNSIPISRRTLAIVAVLVPLVGLLGYVALRSGPLAPVAVTVVKVEEKALRPAVFGVGNVEARQVHRIGPTAPGRLLRLSAEVGDTVKVGQLLGEMDPVDNDDRLRSQEAVVRRAAAMSEDATARHTHAATQARRYEQLFAEKATSEELLAARRQDLQLATALHSAAREDQARAQSDLQALRSQRASLRLVAPVNGVITSREVEPGTTVVAGQAVIEVIDPKTLWINTRFDQVSAGGLTAAQPAQIALRSRRSQPLDGQVQRTELRADAVTEELLAKISFKALPEPLPPIGERAEVTVYLPELPRGPVIPNAAVQRQGKQVGVWVAYGERVGFIPVKLGRADLSGHVQVLDGLKAGDAIVLFSEKALSERSRVSVVERLTGATP
ncbi:MAG: efflux RND transporter periplasmic adaptor subunit [Burkholderiales bacterium]|nr:efflux RND transporter periplasmic adaptor subunit [Burkholderiales bacterium]